MRFQNSRKRIGVFSKGLNLKNAVRKVSFSTIFMAENLDVTENSANTPSRLYITMRPRVIHLINSNLQYISVKRIHPLFAVSCIHITPSRKSFRQINEIWKQLSI
ncbi:MAG: hypothetical protein RSB69_07605, partial [Odoribacter sp.]